MLLAEVGVHEPWGPQKPFYLANVNRLGEISSIWDKNVKPLATILMAYFALGQILNLPW